MLSKLKDNPVNQKKFKRFVYVVSAIVGLAILGLFYYNGSLERDLLKHGIREELVVVRKYKSGSKTKYSTYHYSMELDRFKVIRERKMYESKDTSGMSNADKFSEKVLSATLGKKSKKVVEYLNDPIHIKYIDAESYNTLSAGKIVTLVYDKNDPRSGRLLSEIE